MGGRFNSGDRVGQHVVQQRRVCTVAVTEHVPSQILQKAVFVTRDDLALREVPWIQCLSAIQIDIDHPAAHQVDQGLVGISTLQNRYQRTGPGHH